MKCRHCQTDLKAFFSDPAFALPSNSYIQQETNTSPKACHTRKMMVCDECWLDHEKRFADAMIKRLDLGPDSMVCDVTVNNGHLLHYFERHNIRCFGIEPIASTAQAAKDKGLDIIDELFSVDLANELARLRQNVDLAVAKNILTQIPDINNFIQGFSILLKENGVLALEFPYFSTLIENKQLDTICHEQYFHFSLTGIKTIFEANGLSVFDVEIWPAQGASLIVFAQPTKTAARKVLQSVANILEREHKAGVTF